MKGENDNKWLILKDAIGETGFQENEIELDEIRDIVKDVNESGKYSAESKKIFAGIASREAIYQNNMDTILKYAADSIDTSKIARITDDIDWYRMFYEHAKIYSSDEMRKIWAAILARKINNDDVSNTLVHTLSVIGKYYADFFCNICRFAWFDMDYRNKAHLFLYMTRNQEAYRSSKITWDKLKHLEYLGLVVCDSTSGFCLEGSRSFRSGKRCIMVDPPG